jgi:hypothetical protein
MRNHGRYLIYQTPALRAKFMGRSSVPPTGQHVMGLVTNVHSPFDPAFPSAAPRRRWTATPSLMRLWHSSSRVAPPGAAASVAPPPCRNRSWVSCRPSVERPRLVPGRVALRPRFPLRAYSHTALADGLNRLRPASSAATRAWQSTGLPLAQSVLGAGPGVATLAELLGQALAPSTAASYQRLWVLFERFCVSAQRIALPASPATVCAYLGTLLEGRRLRGTSIRPYIAAIGTQHRRLALADPTLHTLVLTARRGFAAADARRRTGAPLRSTA